LIPDGRLPIYIVLENVRSLFNVGAVFRTADAVAAAGVYLTGFTGTPPRKEISRVALGAEQSVPWQYVEDSPVAIETLRSNGVHVVALEQTDESIDFRQCTYPVPVAVVVGHEVEGVSRRALDVCDGAVHIPMLGEKVSLNVSVAAGVMLYELLRSVQAAGNGY
jgi:23S rRNA (guanosine2251-2'-O)-methyltransferase